MSEGAGRRATRYTLRFHTTVTNHGDTDAEVTLIDQIPLSDTDFFATGDLDGDSHLDLAMGASGDPDGTFGRAVTYPGAVHVIFGPATSRAMASWTSRWARRSTMPTTAPRTWGESTSCPDRSARPGRHHWGGARRVLARPLMQKKLTINSYN